MTTSLGVSASLDLHAAPSGPAAAAQRMNVAGLRVMLVSTNADLAGAPTHVRAVACALALA